MDENNILPITSDFEQIKRLSENGIEFWCSRDLCTALGYNTYQKFSRTIDKAIAIANTKGLNAAEHFNPMVEMVKLGSGAFRKVENIHLSRMACFIIAENADGKKPQVQMAREYFRRETPISELIYNNVSSNILLYKTKQGEVRIEVIFNNETFWMSQKRMADLFGVDVRTINYHLGQIYESGELTKEATIRKIGIVQLEEDRDVECTPLFYNLDAVIAVGYRVNSHQATLFRIWATSVLKDMIVKGFVLDDERFKQGKHFGKDYFDDLLERIREIRASERMYYQKITDIYEECSSDYDPKSVTTQQFFKSVRDIMHWAVTHQTEAEIVYLRADAKLPHMGLTTWKNAPNGRVQRSDAIAATNYLSDSEASGLNRLSSAFIDMAELRAKKQLLSTMEDWKKFLDDFLTLYDYDRLDDAGTISAEQAKEKAYAEYDKFRLIQDKEYLSDFDKEIQKYKELGLK